MTEREMTMSEITPSQTVGPFFAYGLTPKGRAQWDPNGNYAWKETVGDNLVTPDATGIPPGEGLAGGRLLGEGLAGPGVPGVDGEELTRPGPPRTGLVLAGGIGPTLPTARPGRGERVPWWVYSHAPVPRAPSNATAATMPATSPFRDRRTCLNAAPGCGYGIPHRVQKLAPDLSWPQLPHESLPWPAGHLPAPERQLSTVLRNPRIVV